MDDFFDIVAELNPNAKIMDGYDRAVAGYVYGASREPLIVYDRQKLIDLLVEEGLAEEEAWEYFGFNQECAYVGEGTPLFLVKTEDAV